MEGGGQPIATRTESVIVFANGKTKHLRSTVEDIKAAIDSAAGPVPLVKLIEPDDSDVWINANHIHAVKRYDPDRRPRQQWTYDI